MKFTVETEPFRRLLGLLAQSRPDRRLKFAPVRLDAARDRLRVQRGQLAAEIEAVIWQEGSAVTAFGKLLEAIQTCGSDPTTEVAVEDGRLRVGNCLLACIDQGPRASMPASSRIFFASEAGVVPSGVPEVCLAC